ncbi:BT3A3 protein, partial [Atractosteus spatula]|nr:BT3A3 protein [Atractosteus spatula]
SERFEVHGPAAPVVVSPGEDAVLPCYLSPDISAEDLEIRWFKKNYHDLICLYESHQYDLVKQNHDYRDRAGLFLQELHRGNVSLTLRDVRRSDHGQYTCMVGSDLMEDNTIIDLVVRALGSQPSVSLHSPGGDQTQLLCRSEGWFPQPAVIWTDRDGNEVTSQPPTVDTDSQGLLSVSSYIPVKQESNIFSCLVRSALPEPDGGSQLHIASQIQESPGILGQVGKQNPWQRAEPRRQDRDEKSLKPVNTEECIRHRGDLGMESRQARSQVRNLNEAQTAVTLDPDTAHCQLKLSEDGKRVRLGEEEKDLSDNPHRFDSRFCVVCREAFTSGRHYWEVEVNDSWRIGVTRESAERKGWFSLSSQQGYWCLFSYQSDFCALTDPETHLPLSLKPRKLGVCVDIEERKVSFYTVESRAHVYTFTDMVFPQGEKIYPVFWTEDLYKDLVLLPAVSVEIKPVTDS